MWEVVRKLDDQSSLYPALLLLAFYSHSDDTLLALRFYI